VISEARVMPHAVQSATLADVLERVLDKGVVIAGDIKVKLVDIELLTIQIRLLIASVDKAKELGIDWWVNNPAFGTGKVGGGDTGHIAELEKRVAKLEAKAPRERVPPPRRREQSPMQTSTGNERRPAMP